MSQSGYLFNEEVITDNDDHYGTSPRVVGAGTGYPNEGPYAGIGPLRQDEDSYLSVGAEDEVTFTVTNDLGESVDVLFEGFLFDPETYESGDLEDDANWDAIDTLTVAAGAEDDLVVDLVADDYSKIRAKVTAAADHGLNEVQTLTLTGGLATETFKLTFNGHESSAVTIPVGGFANVTAAQIKAALLTISDWTTKTADIAVVKSGNNYTITFSGTLGSTDIGPITVTSKTGAANGSVAETNKGGDFKLSISWTSTRGDSAFSGIR